MPVVISWFQTSLCRRYAAHARCSVSLSASSLYSLKADIRWRFPAASECLLVGVGDRVGQPAGRTNHRHRAVSQTVHLVQPTRLVLAGHQEHVGPGLDLVGQRAGEIESHAIFCGNCSPEFIELFVVFRLAGAQSITHWTSCSCSPVLHHLDDQINAFLVAEPADQPDQRNVGLLGQSELLLQRGLAGGFALGERVRRRSWPQDADRSSGSNGRRPSR